jgi:hypothetical protein
VIALAPFRTGAIRDFGGAQIRGAARGLGGLLALDRIEVEGENGFHVLRVPLRPIFTQWFVSIIVITRIYRCS